MSLKDLGREEKEFYDGPEIAKGEPRINYPEISLPLDLVKDMDLNVGDEVTITVKGKISGLEDTKCNKSVTIEGKEGEIVKDTKSK